MFFHLLFATVLARRPQGEKYSSRETGSSIVYTKALPEKANDDSENF